MRTDVDTPPRDDRDASPPWWRRPIHPDTWRLQLAVVLVAPTAAAALALSLAGRHGSAAELQRRIVRSVPPRPGDPAPSDRVSRPRVVAHALVSLPIGVAGVVVTVYAWLLVALNLAYPLRPGLEYADAWGGPTLAGAWAVHAAGGLVFLFVTPWVVLGVARLQRWTTDGLLGSAAEHRP